MVKWMKRGVLVSTALITLGFAPPTDVVRGTENSSLPEKSENTDNGKPIIYRVDADSYGLYDSVLKTPNHYVHLADETTARLFADGIIEEAYEQSLKKFGPVIARKIGSMYEEKILPEFKHAIVDAVAGMPVDDLNDLKVSDDPASGQGEKIVHLYHQKTGNDLLRLHVRRDQPPKQGYWFNFHYHSYEDQFQSHRELGTVFWGKNMPPYWQA
ncbi:YpjP family protein [Halalkalibacterium halodurans]|uniref:YpjP family protein n=1 Tax=Halalkalibacterium halodurans TaxID=86665 RepID=UPI002E241121|nr:YpjP family protein [Halalkalibacterium halodurans]